MFGSLFDDIDHQRDREPDPAAEVRVVADDPMLAALPVVRSIALRGTGTSGWQQDVTDLVQRVFTKLVTWKSRNGMRSADMTAEDWRAFGARSAFNETRRRPGGNVGRELAIDDTVDVPCEASVEGNTRAELQSLLKQTWTELQRLSTQQFQALVLTSDELAIYLLQAGISEAELLGKMELGDEDWTQIAARIPFSDEALAEYLNDRSPARPVSAKALKKSRYDARKKLSEVIGR